MVKYTDKYNLPTGVSRANKNIPSSYSRGTSDISVTQLIDSPQIKILKEKYDDQIEQDLSEMFWSVLGTSVHHIIEHSDTTENTIKEKRFYCECNGWKISGAIDRIIIEEE